MTTTIDDEKKQSVSSTPLLFFQCILPTGAPPQYWCTHGIAFNGAAYTPRILKHNLFDLALSADDAMDGVSQVSVTLANADSQMTELNAQYGLKGAQLTIYFAFADLAASAIVTESTVLFRGIAGDPDEITEELLTVTFTNKLTLQRIPLPEVRIQRSCPWNFPADSGQRAEAATGGAAGPFSRFYRCGYSPDAGGVGNLDGLQPFTACDKSRASCTARGMFDTDFSNRRTARFGGLEFIPSTILVRTAGDKTSHVSPLVDNAASYNDPVPLVYGIGWLKSPVIFARNDGNLTHMETLLGMGVIDQVLKVVVNNVEIPIAVANQDMTASGWYSIISTGDRQGAFNTDFLDTNGNPLGDPHGSLASLSIVVPNRISSGRSVATVQVLMQGVRVNIGDSSGNLNPVPVFSSNPAWIILDILRRCGWSLAELDLTTFANAASFCDEVIPSQDLNGLPITISRYKCNLILTRRQSAAAVVRGIRVGSSLMLRYGFSGLLELTPETTIAGQQPTFPQSGNSLADAPLLGGWPAYEFSDDSTFSGIVRNANGASSLRFISNSVAQTTNRLSVEFQDESNEYQQDSLSVVDADDVGLIGYENSSQSVALGIPSFNQANRVLLRQLDKSTKGNEYVQFQTSFRALKVRPGDIITLSYLKASYNRVPFRVVKLSPSLNYELVTVLAQIHDDAWYSDNPTVIAGAGRQPGSQTQTPLPLIGTNPAIDNGFFDFGITEALQTLRDGTTIDTVSIGFTVPAKPTANAPGAPSLTLSQAPEYSAGDGSSAPASFYYAVSAVDAAGNEGPLSFTIHAQPTAGNQTVKLKGFSFSSSAVAFNVYKGATPQLLYRIASLQPLAAYFTDPGLVYLPIGPPDANFDHANFYYRYQYAGPFQATDSSNTTITQADLGAVGVNYAGMVVRITEGAGQGQERSIVSNTFDTLTVMPTWSVNPGISSTFVIAQASWTFAAVSSISPAQFQIGYQPGAVIQISGRGADVHDQEGSPDLCPVTTWTLGGSAPDSGLPTIPSFRLDAPGGGELALSQVGFINPQNTDSITSGTLQVIWWNELNYPSPFTLGVAIAPTDVQINVNPAVTPLPLGRIIQIDQELMILSTSPAAGIYTVVRGRFESSASSHGIGAQVLLLDNSTIVVPFAEGFFENRASANFLHTFSLPDVRVAAAQFYVNNRFGISQPRTNCYTEPSGVVLRTLSGGQFSLQVNGYMATQQNAAPPLFVQATHAVRDIHAALNEAPVGFDIAITINQNGNTYQTLLIPNNSLVAVPVVDGFTFANESQLLPLIQGAVLTLNITLNPIVPAPASPSPGRDLTVTIRF